MNVRITHLRIKPGFLDALKRTYSTDLLQILREQPGFLFAYLHQDVNEEGTDCISVTGWENRNEFEYFLGSSSYKEFVEKIRPFVDTSAPRKSYELVTGGEKV
jgi:heme-degrading monooxygenase HmoA